MVVVDWKDIELLTTIMSMEAHSNSEADNEFDNRSIFAALTYNLTLLLDGKDVTPGTRILLDEFKITYETADEIVEKIMEDTEIPYV